jgi:hypothetical protein
MGPFEQPSASRGPAVNEQEWLRCEDPQLLYAQARRAVPPLSRSGRRRLRLYACACCRQVWRLLDDAGRAAVEAAEGNADSRIAPADLGKARELATWSTFDTAFMPWRRKGAQGTPRASKDAVRCARYAAGHAARLATESAITTQAGQAAWFALHAAACLVADKEVAVVATCRSPLDLLGAACALAADKQAAIVAHCRLQCDLLRDVFGNPFRPVAADPAWLRWNDRTVVKVARAIYEERAFERLPVLADALEDAGCTEEAILAHLRGPGPHVRGCWALDLLRGE